MGISPETRPEPAPGRPDVPTRAVSLGQPRHNATGTLGRSPADPLRVGGRSRVLLIEDDTGGALLVEDMVPDSGPPLDLVRARSLADAPVQLRAGRAPRALLDPRPPGARTLDAPGGGLADDAAVLLLEWTV